jgi:hypothetical protein
MCVSMCVDARVCVDVHVVCVDAHVRASVCAYRQVCGAAVLSSGVRSQLVASAVVQQLLLRTEHPHASRSLLPVYILQSKPVE